MSRSLSSLALSVMLAPALPALGQEDDLRELRRLVSDYRANLERAEVGPFGSGTEGAARAEVDALRSALAERKAEIYGGTGDLDQVRAEISALIPALPEETAVGPLRGGVMVARPASSPINVGNSENTDGWEPEFQQFVDTGFFGGDLTKDGHREVSLGDCEAICAASEECSGYTYVLDKSWCWPKHDVSRPVAGRPGLKSGVKTKEPSVPRFRHIPDTDLFGGDLTKDGHREVSLGDCEAICAASDECRGYTYVLGKSWCWPKHDVSQPVPRRSGMTSGVKTRGFSVPRFRRIPDTDLLGGDLTQAGYRGISVGDCEAICAASDECEGYTYVLGKNWCFPKHDVSRPLSGKPGLISAVVLGSSG